MPNGAKIIFLTVGGRTSAVIPSVQKKTGPVAGDVEDGDGGEGGKEKKAKKRGAPKKAVKAEDPSDHETDGDEIEEQKPKRGKKRAAPTQPTKVEEQNDHEPEEPPKKRLSRATKTQSNIKDAAYYRAHPNRMNFKTPARLSAPLVDNGINSAANNHSDDGPELEAEDEVEPEVEDEPKPAPSKHRKTKAEPTSREKTKVQQVKENVDAPSGRRRSTRVSGASA